MEPVPQTVSAMSTKKWLVVAAVGIGLGMLGMALVLVLLFGVFTGYGETATVGSGLPIYTEEQSASSQEGYRHRSLTCGDIVYVNDYEESALQLVNPEPQTVIGQLGALGGARICSIPGQPATAYVACDDGSEMPAYVPYRNIKQKPFDWRSATFREMSAYHARQGGPYLTTTNEALLAEVVRNLRDATPVELPSLTFAGMADLDSIKMTSDQLPSLLFCPYVFTDAKGQIYLAESLMIDAKSTPPRLHARWVPASPTVAQWLNAP